MACRITLACWPMVWAITPGQFLKMKTQGFCFQTLSEMQEYETFFEVFRSFPNVGFSWNPGTVTLLCFWCLFLRSSALFVHYLPQIFRAKTIFFI
jgi:hypothetical protein